MARRRLKPAEAWPQTPNPHGPAHDPYPGDKSSSGHTSRLGPVWMHEGHVHSRNGSMPWPEGARGDGGSDDDDDWQRTRAGIRNAMRNSSGRY